MIIKGQNVRIKIGGKVIACSTSCTCHKAANLEEVTSKDSTGMYAEQDVTGLSWDLSIEALAFVPDESGTDDAIQFDDALDLVGQTVEVEFDQTDGAKNRNTVKTLRHGKAIVNDVSQTWGNKQNGTYSLQAQGTGELFKGAKS